MVLLPSQDTVFKDCSRHWDMLSILLEVLSSFYDPATASLYLLPGWMGLWANWSGGRCPCPWQRGWKKMMSLPTQTIPWFYDSMIYHGTGQNRCRADSDGQLNPGQTEGSPPKWSTFFLFICIHLSRPVSSP